MLECRHGKHSLEFVQRRQFAEHSTQHVQPLAWWLQTVRFVEHQHSTWRLLVIIQARCRREMLPRSGDEEWDARIMCLYLALCIHQEKRHIRASSSAPRGFNTRALVHAVPVLGSDHARRVVKDQLGVAKGGCAERLHPRRVSLPRHSRHLCAQCVSTALRLVRQRAQRTRSPAVRPVCWSECSSLRSARQSPRRAQFSEFARAWTTRQGRQCGVRQCTERTCRVLSAAAPSSAVRALLRNSSSPSSSSSSKPSK